MPDGTVNVPLDVKIEANIPEPLLGGAAETQDVPLLVSTLPFAPGLVTPVPPLATATVPVTFVALPEILPLTLDPDRDVSQDGSE
jgi:hypothetical protein